MSESGSGSVTYGRKRNSSGGRFMIAGLRVRHDYRVIVFTLGANVFAVITNPLSAVLDRGRSFGQANGS